MMNWPTLSILSITTVTPFFIQSSIIDLGIKLYQISIYPLYSLYIGAIVNALLPYSSLEKVNVFGTGEIVRLAKSGGKLKHIHYISTLSVFPRLNFTIPETYLLQEEYFPRLGGYGYVQAAF